jgi:TonB family protein
LGILALSACVLASTPAADQTNKPSPGTLRGRFSVGFVPGKEGPESIKLVFQDLASCHTYDVIYSGGGTLEYNTEGFYVVVGRVVGGRLEAKSSAKADEAATGQLRVLERKCSPAKSTAATKTAATTTAFIEVPGGVQAAHLIRRIQPIYPPLAKAARVQGAVRFNAVIARDGTVQNLRTLAGHPLLELAASEAVKQWLYAPTLSGGEPVEVHTTIDVIFTLDQ